MAIKSIYNYTEPTDEMYYEEGFYMFSKLWADKTDGGYYEMYATPNWDEDTQEEYYSIFCTNNRGYAFLHGELSPLSEKDEAIPSGVSMYEYPVTINGSTYDALNIFFRSSAIAPEQNERGHVCFFCVDDVLHCLVGDDEFAIRS